MPASIDTRFKMKVLLIHQLLKPIRMDIEAISAAGARIAVEALDA